MSDAWSEMVCDRVESYNLVGSDKVYFLHEHEGERKLVFLTLGSEAITTNASN